MGDSPRDGGFLRPKEKYLLSEWGYHPPVDVEPPASPKQTKHQYNDEVVSAAGIQEIVDGFRGDLLTVEHHQRSTDAERFKMRLELAQPELERLRDQLTRLIEFAENDEILEPRTELRGALHTLYDDLRYYPASKDGYDGRIDPDSVEREQNEKQERTQALETLLKNTSWREVLRHIEENPGEPLPDEKHDPGGWHWNRIAAELNNMGLVEQDDTWQNKLKFEITTRGKMVLNAYAALSDTETVRLREESAVDTSRDKVILQLLSEKFGGSFNV